jgi:L-alanine-DL-glutamate epimerase-like enolase superfamily enzyme
MATGGTIEMRIREVRELNVPLSGEVSNAVVSFTGHTVSLVALISDQFRKGKPVTGFGFNSIGRFAQSGILRERMMPRLLQTPVETLLAADGQSLDAAAVAKAAMRNEKPGGHGDRAGAVAALELAAWDLNAKLADEPAWKTIARHFGRAPAQPATAVYAAGGYYYPDDSLRRLRDELVRYQSLGYDAYKIKIGGAPLAKDLERIDVALRIAGTGSRLAVDANGRFDREQAVAYGRALAPFGLRWYEEPGDPLDFALNADLIMDYGGSVATGENLFSRIDACNLIRYGGMRPGLDIFQMDPGLSYGLTEYAGMLDSLDEKGFDRGQCYPHGGHLINLHIAIGLELGGCEAYPGVFQPFGGYSLQCQIGNGLVQASDAPGFGLEQKVALSPYLEKLST